MSGAAHGDCPVLEARRNHFRILQMTDLHSDVEERLNERTRADIAAMVTRFAPDLLAVLGDIWCGDNHPEAAPMWMLRDAAFFSELGVPWALVLGNHDYVTSLDEARTRLSRMPHCALPPGDGEAACRIEVRGSGNSGPCWDLFFLHSGEAWRVPGHTAWFERESARLRQTRGRVVPGIAYFHLPTGNYQRAIDEGRTCGPGDENVLGWGDDDNMVAKRLTSQGNLRACFCGHSHRNDFHFVEDGVTFAYTRATGHGGYGQDSLAKGATLLELDTRGEAFRFRTVFADGSEYTPD